MKQTRDEIKGFGMLIVVAVIALLLIVATGLYVVNSTKSLDTNKDSERNVNKEYTKGEDENYDSSKQAYETSKPVSTDNSFSSIDSDIDNTVIVEEDFSDL